VTIERGGPDLFLSGLYCSPLGEASGLPFPPLLLLSSPLQIMHALTVTAKLSALFGGSLFALFVGTLVIEDQRHFVSCRMAGGSVDACLLQINGR
jgi:hypothetical protein